MFLITVSNFPAFMILNGILCILGSIINLTYISYVTDFSVKTKYRTFTYLLLQTPPFLASIIFVPIGTQLSTVIKFENLVILSCFLFVISGILLFISLILKDKKPMDMLEYSIDELEQSKIA